MVKVHEPALILLDLRMPIMDGWSFVEQYRRASVAPAAIVLMSANPDLPGIAQHLGADGHLRKPFDLDELCASVAMRMTGNGPAARP
jgi:two-component system chemotaxis response regulator CheY